MKSSSVIARFFCVFVPSLLLLAYSTDKIDNTSERQLINCKSIPSKGGRLDLLNFNEGTVILKLPGDALSTKSAITMTALYKIPNSSISNIAFTKVIIEPSDLIFNPNNTSRFYLNVVEFI